MNKFKIGQLVGWTEDYADQIAGKDSGSGIIIDIENYKSFYSGNETISYRVYRSKFKDLYWFDGRQLYFLKDNLCAESLAQ